MALIKLLDKKNEVVKDAHERPHDLNSLQPLPRLIEEEDKKFRFSHKEGSVSVYKESNF